MKLIGGAWKILVGIKDFLVLIFMLLFFVGLFAVLSTRPNVASVREGALLISLNGSLVEQPVPADPLATLTGASEVGEIRLGDVLHALDTAVTDKRVKAVVLDLDRFAGGYPAGIQEVRTAVMKVRDAKKPVLVYATAFTDAGYGIAAGASEIWTHPMGGVLFAGMGGTNLYYKGLLDKLGVTAHVYKVGKFKSAVEPYILTGMSPEAREASEQLYGQLSAQWQEGIKQARPKAQFAALLTQPAEQIEAAKGDVSKANQDAGLIDRVGDRLAFGQRVAEIVGAPPRKAAGNFKAIKFANYLAANPRSKSGDAIGVLTVAGDIVDGSASAGTAGGDTISSLLLTALAEKKLKALVVRVDSPGGSAMASERMRLAVLEAKKQGLPVVISMGNLAASGGYWVATAGDTIFASPNTITGSIGIFGVVPTFEKGLAKIGVTSDGVKTTPLSGQPDVLGGVNATFDRVLQASIEQGYNRFIGIVAQARKLSPERVDEIGQGRVWTGATARELGLVDQYGTLSDAIAEAARRAKLDPAKVHPLYLEEKASGFGKILADLMRDEGGGSDDWADSPSGGDAFARIGEQQRGLMMKALADAKLLTQASSVQARCLECAGLAPATPRREDRSLFDYLLGRVFG